MMERRPIKTRSLDVVKNIASFLARIGVSPNHISLLSIIFSVIALGCYGMVNNSSIYLIFAIIAIQLRLLCNLFDGMVAVEHNQKTITGELYNDVPDRFADFFIILGAGLASSGLPYSVLISLVAASVAITTAYVRVLGAAMNCRHYFNGPMAKQHRMAVLSIAALVDFILIQTSVVLLAYTTYFALFVIVLGGLLTIGNRLSKISKELHQRVST
jgi:phosphatidylglycerophosphate synthase